ncbi:MAG: hypothetical protein METHSR3v1_1270019 [Methanothrix sp.]|nr:MAG: hypothetical protein METHSR3v1_1270019 [Methanothrix sp.]
MGEHKSEKLYVSVPSVVNRYALTQPQRRRGTEVIISAGPDPHNSAKSRLNRFPESCLRFS